MQPLQCHHTCGVMTLFYTTLDGASRHTEDRRTRVEQRLGAPGKGQVLDLCSQAMALYSLMVTPGVQDISFQEDYRGPEYVRISLDV